MLEHVQSVCAAHANRSPKRLMLVMMPIVRGHASPNAGAEAEERFEQVATRFLADASVTGGTGFGSSPGLRVEGKIFAMLAKGELVVKLSKNRVDQLVAAGSARRFDPGRGRLMKEWAAVSLAAADDWERLVDEALRFVGRRS
jgi:hypothetical protein